MKKKEKKYYGKKKKFYSFFLKIFIPFIIVTSILGGIITAFLNLTFQNNISSNVQAAEKTIRQAGIKYWNIYQTELEEQKDTDYEFQTPYDHYQDQLRLNRYRTISSTDPLLKLLLLLSIATPRLYLNLLILKVMCSEYRLIDS